MAIGAVISSVFNVAGEATGVGLGASALNSQLGAGSGDDMVRDGAGSYNDPYGVAGRGKGKGPRNRTSIQGATIWNPYILVFPVICSCMCFMMMLSLMVAM